MRALLAAVLMTGAMLAASAAHTQDFVGTRALAMGEAYRAVATGNEAIYYNPAGLVLVKRFSPEVHYHMNLEQEQHTADASIVDSKTGDLAAGVSYTFQGAEFTKRTTLQHTGTLAVAYPFLEKLLCVGIGLKYINVSDALLGGYVNALSADGGLLSRLPGGLSLAAVGYNLIPLKTARAPLSAGFAAALDLGPLSSWFFGAGATNGFRQDPSGVIVPMLPGTGRGPLDGMTLSFDWQINFRTLYGTKSRYSAGFEWLLADSLPVRMGYRFDELTEAHAFAVGTGLIVPYFGFDIGYQQTVGTWDDRVFAMALKFFLPV